MSIEELLNTEPIAIDSEFGETLAEEIASSTNLAALLALKQLVDKRLIELSSSVK